MKKEDKSWDFLINCNQNQRQLVSDVMGYERGNVTDSIRDVDFEVDGFPSKYADFIKKNTRGLKALLMYVVCTDKDGYYITYGEFLQHIVDTIAERPKNVLLSSKKYEREENILLLSCLKSVGESHPRFFKTLYNLASSSAEDVVEELEVRFYTSPALRASLPAVLCTMLAKDCSIELSEEGKQAIDENLTMLEQNSLSGNYRYVGSLAKLESLNPLWLLGGPAGMIFGMLYSVGKQFFSKDGKSADKDLAYNDNADCKQVLLLACTLIMLRRENCGIVLNKDVAFRMVCNWMEKRQSSIDGSISNEEYKRFVEPLFLKLLKGKDESKFQLVMKACGYVDESRVQAYPEIDSEVERLLPHSAFLVEKLWPYFGLDHTKSYAYTMPQLIERMNRGKCLVTEFHPDFVVRDNSVHFLVEDNTRGIAMLCLELMGHDSTVLCKDFASLKKEYRNIFVSNESQREKMHPYCFGKVYSLYAKFDGKDPHAAQKELEEKELREKLQMAQEELKECCEQIVTYEKKMAVIDKEIDKYKETIAEFEDDAIAFRHDHMNNHFLRKMRGYIYKMKKGEFESDDILGVEVLIDDLKKYVDQFAKSEPSQSCSLWTTAIEAFNDLKGIEIVLDNQCPDESIVKLKKNMFSNRILGNIKQNILQHAFPENHGIPNPRVKISLEKKASKYVLTIANNGVPFRGDLNKVFEKNVSYGNSTGEGMYLAERCLKRFQRGCDIMAYVPSDGYSFAIEITIK